MYAIVQSGGKQYKVSKDTIFSVDKIDAEKGAKVALDVIMTSQEGKVTVGNPIVSNVVVNAEVVAQYKDDKVIVYKYKAKKNVRKKQGHRQPYTKLKVLSIETK